MLGTFVGCSKQASNEEIAEEFIKKVLTAPNETLAKINADETLREPKISDSNIVIW
jgi:hypothetical protein